ncbi:MAG: TIGR00730 family Rossman fold protein [Puniceicoccales bacterium]
MATICVFCGANNGCDKVYLDAAERVGCLIASEGHTLVYGGGRTGLMGTVADAALAAGGQVIGVITRLLSDKEIAHSGLTDLRIVDSMHERKLTMATLADGFIALPGGIGTLEEFAEVFTWTQLGIHPKSCALLDVDGYYRPLVEFFNQMVDNGFLGQEQLDQLIVESDERRLLERVLHEKPEVFLKWLDNSAEFC